MKVTIRTFVAFGKHVSLDISAKIEGLPEGERNFFAVSQNVAYASRNRMLHIDCVDVKDSACRLLFDLRGMLRDAFGKSRMFDVLLHLLDCIECIRIDSSELGNLTATLENLSKLNGRTFDLS